MHRRDNHSRWPSWLGGDGGGRLLEGSDRRFALRSLGRGLLGPDLAFGHLRVFVRELAFQLSTIQG